MSRVEVEGHIAAALKRVREEIADMDSAQLDAIHFSYVRSNAGDVATIGAGDTEGIRAIFAAFAATVREAVA